MPSGSGDGPVILHALIFDADGHAVLPRLESDAGQLAHSIAGQVGRADFPHRDPDDDTCDNSVCLERRLAQAILKTPPGCHLQPMVFILGETWALTRWKAGCYWALLCEGALAEALEEGRAGRLEAFLHQLADCIVFFCGSEGLPAGIRKKRPFVELILELVTVAGRSLSRWNEQSQRSDVESSEEVR